MEGEQLYAREIPFRNRYEFFINGWVVPPANGTYINMENPRYRDLLIHDERGNTSDIAKAINSAQECNQT